MLEKKIRLEAIDDVREFVQAATRCNFDVDISYNRMVIDAKINSWCNEPGPHKGFKGAVPYRGQ